MLKFFRIPFGSSGDKAAVPDATQVDGSVSYQQGYGPDYERPVTDPATKNIERNKNNQLWFDVTTELGNLQAQGVPDFITNVLNGGSPYSYSANSLVRYSGTLYQSMVDANTSLPTDATKWLPMPVNGAPAWFVPLTVGNSRTLNNPTGDARHLVEIVNDDSGLQVLSLTSHGITANGNNVHFNRTNGTAAAPTAIGAGSFLMSFGFRGWDGSGSMSQSMGAFQAVTREAWTPAAHGLALVLAVTDPGGSTRRTAVQVASESANAGGLVLGDGTASKLAFLRGSGNVSGISAQGDDGGTGAQLDLFGGSYAGSGALFRTKGVSYRFQNQAGTTDFAQIDSSGNVNIGPIVSAVHTISKTVTNDAGNAVLLVGTPGNASAFYGVSGGSPNGANAALRILKDAGTNRSINAAGTVNVNGADFAERVRRAEGVDPLVPGAVVGFDHDGRITDRWADALSFAVISTDPGFVGNDIHDTADDAIEVVAFCGQCPVSVPGAAPGDYIVPVATSGGGIKGSAVASPSFDQYRQAVGRVLTIQPDGRARIAVKVS